MISLRAKFVRAVTGAYFASVDTKKVKVQSIRGRWHFFSKFLRVARGVKRKSDQINGLTAEWLAPKNAADNKLILYLHGGAYIMGGCATHRQLVSHIARAAGVRALLPEYRLAPENPFPAAVDDAVGIYRTLLKGDYSARDIVIAGDSAGGGLTMATLLSLRDAGDPLPAAVCLLSPWLDLAATGETMATNARKDPWFKPEDMPFVASYYCDKDQFKNPLASPLYGDFSGLPPIYFQVGEDEILLSDSVRAARKAEEAGGEVELEIWPGMWHVFQVFMRQMPESRAAIRKLGAFIHKALDTN